MLNKAFEFLRIADPQPSNEKVRLRTKSATDLVAHFSLKENRDTLLRVVQGAVAGFDSPVFAQESPSVVLLIKAIKDGDGGDAAFPSDLKENGLELRAIAGMVVGELLASSLKGDISAEAMLTALSISAASLRPSASEKHIRWMSQALKSEADKVLQLGAVQCRLRGTPALQQLDDIELPEEGEDTEEEWKKIVPAVKAALFEAKEQAAIDREEIETLWWMFAAFSELEHKPIGELSPSAAAFASGIELGRRSLLPPSPSAIGMVERIVKSGRKASALTPITLEHAIADWTQPMLDSLVPVDEKIGKVVSQCPAILPLSWACRRLREGGTATLGNDFTSATGLPINHPLPPSAWGAQVFRETVLLRVLTGVEES